MKEARKRRSRAAWIVAALAMSIGADSTAVAIDVCGNDFCAINARPAETCSTCPEDCGPCPEPPPPPPEFSDLKDPSDGLAGRLAAPNIKVPFEATGRSSFGQERRFASHLSIAVDPATSSRVYIAWADLPGGVPPYTLHVRRSDNRGLTWTADLITVTNAANPALAVNNAGKVAFLYQQNTPIGVPLENQKWQTHVRRSANQGATWDDLVLANTPASQPVAATMPYLGDYVQIQAVGKDFYGIFSASNVPDLAHFPSGVVYQRRADFNTHELKNTAGTAVVAPSIDPFFFRLTEP